MKRILLGLLLIAPQHVKAQVPGYYVWRDSVVGTKTVRYWTAGQVTAATKTQVTFQYDNWWRFKQWSSKDGVSFIATIDTGTQWGTPYMDIAWVGNDATYQDNTSIGIDGARWGFTADTYRRATFKLNSTIPTLGQVCFDLAWAGEQWPRGQYYGDTAPKFWAYSDHECFSSWPNPMTVEPRYIQRFFSNYSVWYAFVARIIPF